MFFLVDSKARKPIICEVFFSNLVALSRRLSILFKYLVLSTITIEFIPVSGFLFKNRIPKDITSGDVC